ncbi:MAG: pyridoxamine 5'-phosphate oxidase family protein [Cloacibacterium normanense]|nr:pyridoxamine 5'-phosphate oxidase family protein [Cloacibacterium normanense]
MSTQNLFQKEAIEKLKELSEKARTCMFVTELDQLPSNSRPMSLQECDDEGNLWFISSKESNKNMEIERDSRVQLYFMNNSDSEYLSVYGKAFIYDDKSTIEEKLSIIAPEDVYYWDTKAGKHVSLLSFATAIVTGNKTDNSDGVEGQISI